MATSSVPTGKRAISGASVRLNEYCSWLLLAGGVITVILALYMVVVSYSPVPFMDQWWFIHRIRAFGGHLSFSYLWELHNEHRIIVPRVLYFTDYYLFGGTNIFLLAIVYVAQMLHVALILWVLRELGRLSGSSLRIAGGVTAFCLLLPTQRATLTSGWEVAFVLPFLCATAGAASLVWFRFRDQRIQWVLFSWLAALIASFSLANGLLLWPLFCLVMLRIRIQWYWTVITAVLGSGIILLYSIGYHSASKSRPLDALHRPVDVLLFIGQYFTAPWTSLNHTVALVATWSAIAVTTAALSWLCWAQCPNPVFFVLLPIAAFQIVTAALTALARLDVGLAARYQTPSLIFWALFATLLICVFNRRSCGTCRLGIQIAVLTIMIASVSHYREVLVDVKGFKHSLDIAADALSADVYDAEALDVLHAVPEYLLPDAEFLRREHRFLFRVDPGRRVGTSIGSYRLAVTGSCGGQLGTVSALSDQRWPGAFVTGTAWDQIHSKPIRQIIVAADGVIVGLGSADNPVDGSSAGPQRASWRGFIPAASRQELITAYGLVNSDTICALGGSRTLNATDFGLAAFYTRQADMPDLVPLWQPDQSIPTIYDGRAAMHKGVMYVHSTGVDTQMYFSSPVRLSRFRSLVFKMMFEKNDTLELFFGRMIDGRGISGFVPTTGRWLYVFANVAKNPHWKDEAQFSFRLDPTSAVAVGSTVKIAGVWGREAELPVGARSFDFKIAVEEDSPAAAAQP